MLQVQKEAARAWLVEMKQAHPELGEIVYETVMGHGAHNVIAGHVYGGLLATVQSFGEEGLQLQGPADPGLEEEPDQAEAEDLIHADPLVRRLLATFPSARIVPGSIRPR